MFSDSSTPLIASRGKRDWWRGSALYWFCQVGGWGAIWLSEIVNIPDAQGGMVYPFAQFLLHLIYYVSALLLTHCWRSFLLHQQWDRLPLSALWWRALLGALVLAAIHNLIGLGYLLKGLREMGMAGPNILLVIATYGLLIWMEFTAWTGLYLGHRAYRQLQDLQILRAEEEAERRKAALQVLRAQVNPHFLFNSLNTVRALIPQHPDKARVAVTKLAELLRTSLDTNNEPLIPLAKEMEAVSSYLHLEQLRYAERLQVKIDISPQAMHRLLPPFTVQALVENAVKHGIERVPQGGLVSITAIETPNQVLEIRVTNPGKIEKLTDTGIGLANSRHRLQLLGGTDSTLELEEDLPTRQVNAILRFTQPL